MWKITSLVLANFVFPTISGILMMQFGVSNCNFYGVYFKDVPCSVINFLIGAAITAIFFDFLFFYLIPKLRVVNPITQNFFPRKNTQKRKLNYLSTIQETSNESSEATLAVRNAFGIQLDKLTKDIKISSPGLVFLNNVKRHPPFLGINPSQSVIPLEYETYITEHFLAKEFVKDVRGGEKYTVKQSDTLDKLALSKYGNKKYSDAIKAKNGVSSLTPGQTIGFPYVNINNPFVLEKDVIERMNIASLKWIKDKLEPLKLNLTDDEVIPLLEAIYYAAQRMRAK